ncbi:cell wall hydrolase [Altererythrobacter sp. H2]|uniref:cell wall hydrolase n=1 Tax=Altererythrobacter sp. H2 TaxID=3108391 RepID=UPI002B4BB066|nr:cell wall hydrolase [Altererythrobacter sp. H2]WRK95117.1 cell wall hydrolase [Altererythrobacter sp. H2]
MAARLRAAFSGRHRGRSLLALAAAIGVPAMAAPLDWGAEADTGFTAPAAVTPMAFEQAGQNFPGSAFYFIEDEARLSYDVDTAPAVLFDQTGTGNAEVAELALRDTVGPSARAFFGGGSGLDRTRALDCLATAIYYEAASESIGGQRAVAQVVLNRVAHPTYPNTVCGVVYQGSERKTGCQFSFTCDGSLRRVPSASAMARARMVARDALAGDVYTPVGLATHYHTIWIYPYWAPSLDHIGTIGAHRFYKWKGPAGTPAAFRWAYAGGEPVSAPNARRTEDYATAAADPIALAKVFEEERRKAEVDSRGAGPVRAAAPAYAPAIEQRGGDAIFTAENLPASGGVKQEYANSGRWIAEPGKPAR